MYENLIDSSKVIFYIAKSPKHPFVLYYFHKYALIFFIPLNPLGSHPQKKQEVNVLFEQLTLSVHILLNHVVFIFEERYG